MAALSGSRQIYDEFSKSNKNPNEFELDNLLDAQSNLLFQAAETPGQLIQDSAIKLSLWHRWNGADLTTPYHSMMPGDAVVYSAFHDLVKILGMADLLPSTDLECDLIDNE